MIEKEKNTDRWPNTVEHKQWPVYKKVFVFEEQQEQRLNGQGVRKRLVTW